MLILLLKKWFMYIKLLIHLYLNERKSGVNCKSIGMLITSRSSYVYTSIKAKGIEWFPTNLVMISCLSSTFMIIKLLFFFWKWGWLRFWSSNSKPLWTLRKRKSDVCLCILFAFCFYDYGLQCWYKDKAGLYISPKKCWSQVSK